MQHAYSFPFSRRVVRRAGPLVAGALLLAQLASAQAATLLSATPRRNAPAAPRTGPVQLTFSASLDPTTVGNIRLNGTRQQGARATTASASAGTVTLALPAGASFGAGEVIQVSVPASVRSTGGQSVRPLAYQFTAAATGPGRGLFTTATDNQATGLASNNQLLADIDGDGDLDLLLTPPAVNYVVTSAVLVRLNSGNGTFSAGPTVPVAGSPNEVALADVDNDGDLDILASCYSGASTITLSTRLNDGRGNFSGGSNLPGLTWGGHLLATADLDADGDLDLVLSTNTAGQTVASVRFNQGNGTFGGGSELYIAGGTGAFVLGDIDGDGDVDFITTGFSTGGIYTCLNQGNGSFGSATTYQLGNYPASIALADLDGDGDLDMLVGCAQPNTVETRLNDGQGNFAATGASVAVGNYPQFVRLADLDSDGDQDVLTGNLYGGDVSVRLNTGGTFGGGSNVSLGKNTFGLATGDLDGDGDIDFLTRATPATGADFLGIGFNQGQSPGPGPGPSCTAADTTATLSPASGLALGCDQAPGTFSASPGAAGTTYEWQYAPGPGAAWQTLPATSQPTYQPTQPGRYRARLKRGGCVATTAAAEVRAFTPATYTVPNIFTPNGDNVNDVFALRLVAPRTFAVQVFNRWGREVFRTSQYGDFWTGAGSPEGVYYYLWRYSTDCDATERTVRGTITLAR